MVYSVLVISALFSILAIVFLAFVASAYRHIPAKVKVKVHHDGHKHLN